VAQITWVLQRGRHQPRTSCNKRVREVPFGKKLRYRSRARGQPRLRTRLCPAMQGRMVQLPIWGFERYRAPQMGGYDVHVFAPCLRWAPTSIPADRREGQNAGRPESAKIGTSGKFAQPIRFKTVVTAKYSIDLDKDAEVLKGAQTLLRGLMERAIWMSAACSIPSRRHDSPPGKFPVSVQVSGNGPAVRLPTLRT